MEYIHKVKLGEEIFFQKTYAWHMKTIISTILDNVRADGTNQTFKYNLLNRIDYYFNYLFFMLTDTSKEFNITYINPNDNKSYSMTLSAVPFKS